MLINDTVNATETFETAARNVVTESFLGRESVRDTYRISRGFRADLTVKFHRNGTTVTLTSGKFKTTTDYGFMLHDNAVENLKSDIAWAVKFAGL